MDSFKTKNFKMNDSVNLIKEEDFSCIKKSINSKDDRVDLLLKDIKKAALKRVNSLRESKSQEKRDLEEQLCNKDVFKRVNSLCEHRDPKKRVLEETCNKDGLKKINSVCESNGQEKGGLRESFNKDAFKRVNSVCESNGQEKGGLRESFNKDAFKRVNSVCESNGQEKRGLRESFNKDAFKRVNSVCESNGQEKGGLRESFNKDAFKRVNSVCESNGQEKRGLRESFNKDAFKRVNSLCESNDQERRGFRESFNKDASKRVNSLCESNGQEKQSVREFCNKGTNDEEKCLENLGEAKTFIKNGSMEPNENGNISKNETSQIKNEEKPLDNVFAKERISFREKENISIISNDSTKNMVPSSDTENVLSRQDDGKISSGLLKSSLNEEYEKETSGTNGNERIEITSDSKRICLDKKYKDDTKELKDKNTKNDILDGIKNTDENVSIIEISQKNTKNQEPSILIKKTSNPLKYNSTKDSGDQNSLVKQTEKLKIPEEIIPDTKQLFQGFQDEPILSGNVAIKKKADPKEKAEDTKSTDVENDDKNRFSKLTSSVSKKADPKEKAEDTKSTDVENDDKNRFSKLTSSVSKKADPKEKAEDTKSTDVENDDKNRFSKLTSSVSKKADPKEKAEDTKSTDVENDDKNRFSKLTSSVSKKADPKEKAEDTKSTDVENDDKNRFSKLTSSVSKKADPKEKAEDTKSTDVENDDKNRFSKLTSSVSKKADPKEKAEDTKSTDVENDDKNRFSKLTSSVSKKADPKEKAEDTKSTDVKNDDKNRFSKLTSSISKKAGAKENTEDTESTDGESDDKNRFSKLTSSISKKAGAKEKAEDTESTDGESDNDNSSSNITSSVSKKADMRKKAEDTESTDGESDTKNKFSNLTSSVSKKLGLKEKSEDTDSTDGEIDDKNSSSNFTSSVSEEEEPRKVGICIIINGRKLPPSSESELENLRSSCENLFLDDKNENDPNSSSSSVFESIEGFIDIHSATNTSDQELTSQENSLNLSKSKPDILSAFLDMMSKTKKANETLVRPTKDKEDLRSILHNLNGKNDENFFRSQSLSLKSVTFSDDTVFNEDKTKRYRKERVSLRHIYRNRGDCSAEAFAKINPLFEEDSDEGEGYVMQTKKQSIQKRSVSLDESKKNENGSAIDKDSLNFPSYMQRFFLNDSKPILTLTNPEGKNGNEEAICDIQESNDDDDLRKEKPTSSSIMSSVTPTENLEKTETSTIKVTKRQDVDEKSSLSNVIGYDMLLKKTIAKEKHHFLMKWLTVFFFLCGLLTIVAIIVYFLIIKG